MKNIKKYKLFLESSNISEIDKLKHICIAYWKFNYMKESTLFIKLDEMEFINDLLFELDVDMYDYGVEDYEIFLQEVLPDRYQQN